MQFFFTCMQFIFWPQGVANALHNLNENRLVGAARALRCILGNCVLFDDAPLGQTGFFPFKDYKSRFSCGRTVFFTA